MPTPVDVCGVYQLPAPIGVTQGCLGKTFTLELSGRRGKATLPALTWEDSEPKITLPRIEPAFADVITQSLESAKRSPLWDLAGKVTGYNPAKRTAYELRVSALLLRFKVPAEDIDCPMKHAGARRIAV
jgi:hypothetical protein